MSRRWLVWANLAWGAVTVLPWTAPFLLKAGYSNLAGAVYRLYSFLCHQLADRSFFLFGPRWMYSQGELWSLGSVGESWDELRDFIGSPELGYKVAWSDRMISMYGGIFVGGLIFALLRRWLKSPRWYVFGLMIAPMVVDGVTHSLSDLAGLNQGFRYHNAWLSVLTGDRFSASFYAGNALGSFNSWMRLISGLLFGLAVVWLSYPVFEEMFRDLRRELEPRLRRVRNLT